MRVFQRGKQMNICRWSEDYKGSCLSNTFWKHRKIKKRKSVNSWMTEINSKKLVQKILYYLWIKW